MDERWDDGVDWHNIRTTTGLAFGTQDGTTNYNDSVAILNGTWARINKVRLPFTPSIKTRNF